MNMYRLVKMSPLAYVKEVTKQYSHLLNVYVTQAMHK